MGHVSTYAACSVIDGRPDAPSGCGASRRSASGRLPRLELPHRHVGNVDRYKRTRRPGLRRVPPQAGHIPDVLVLSVASIDPELQAGTRGKLPLGTPRRAQDPARPVDIDCAVRAWHQRGRDETHAEVPCRCNVDVRVIRVREYGGEVLDVDGWRIRRAS